MELIIALILGAIVFGKIWADKAAGKEYDRKSTARKTEQERFLEAVVDEELEKKIKEAAMTEESLEKVKAVIESIPACVKMYEMNQDTLSHKVCFYDMNIRTLILMAQHGKLPEWGGVHRFSMWRSSISGYCSINYSLEAEMALAKWIQSQLRNHGVEAQAIYDDGIDENGRVQRPAAFYWEPFSAEPFSTSGIRL